MRPRILIAATSIITAGIVAATATGAALAATTVDLDGHSARIALLSTSELSDPSKAEVVQSADGSAAVSYQLTAPSKVVNGEVTTTSNADVVIVRGPGASAWSKPLRVPIPTGYNSAMPTSNQRLIGLPGGRFAFLTWYTAQKPSADPTKGGVQVRIWNGSSWSAPVISLETAPFVAGLAADRSGRVMLVISHGMKLPSGGTYGSQVSLVTWSKAAGVATTALSGDWGANPVIGSDGDRTLVAWLAADNQIEPGSQLLTGFTPPRLVFASVSGGVASAPTTLVQFPDQTSFPLAIGVRGGQSYVAWSTHPTPTQSRVEYRYGSDLATAPTRLINGELAASGAARGVHAARLFVLGAKGPQFAFTNSTGTAGYLRGIDGDADAERRLPLPAPAAISALADGSVRLLAHGQASDSVPALLRIGPAGTIDARLQLVKAAKPSIPGNLLQSSMWLTDSRGALARIVYVHGGELRTAVLFDGGARADRLVGSLEDETLLGGAGNDTLSGDVGDDRLEGGIGNDRLNGGAGVDELFGGAGNDVIDARDPRASVRAKDAVRCGAGVDRVLADPTDIVGRDCEFLNGSPRR